jgi:hypothetical protein
MPLKILEYLYEEDDDTLSYYTTKKADLPIETDLIEFNKSRF